MMKPVILPGDAPFQDVRYDEAQFIGRGALGSVYKGTAVDVATREEIAIVVKMPLTKDRYEEIDLEYDLLRDLQRQTALDHALPARQVALPPVAKGFLDDDTPTLVMPYYDQGDLVARSVRDLLEQNRLIEAELLAIETAIAFVCVMESLHHLQPSRSCNDRKVKDYYRLKDGRNVVIDWNVLREDTREYRAGEFRLFGYLWHELFLGRKGNPPLDPYNDAIWQIFPNAETPTERYTDPSQPFQSQGAISAGLRELIAQAVDFDPSHSKLLGESGDISYPALRRILETWHRMLKDGAAAYEIEQLFEVGMEEAQFIARDLEWRAKQTMEPEQRRDEALAAAQHKRGNEEEASRETITNRFKIDPQAALQEVELYLGKYEDRADWENWAHARRWSQIIDLIDRVQVDSLTRQDIQRNLLGVGTQLHQNPIQDTVQSLDDACSALERAREALGSSSRDFAQILDMLALEIDIRKHTRVNPFDAGQPFSERKRALAGIVTAIKALKEGHYLDGPASLPDSERVGRTPLRRLLQNYDAVVWLDEFEKLDEMTSTLDASGRRLREMSQLLQTAALDDDERILTRQEARPLLELASFLELFGGVVEYDEVLRIPEMFRYVQRMKTIDAARGDVSDVRRTFNRLTASVIAHYERAFHQRLRLALETVSPDEFALLKPVQIAWKAAENNDLYRSQDQSFRNCVALFGNVVALALSWSNSLTQFLNSSPREARENIRGLMAVIQQIDRLREVEKVDMRNLLGDFDLQRENLQKLESSMLDSVKEAQDKLNILEHDLAEHNITISEQTNKFGKLFEVLHTDIASKKADIEQLLQGTLYTYYEVEVMEALRAFDLPHAEHIEQQLQQMRKDERTVPLQQQLRKGIRDLHILQIEASILLNVPEAQALLELRTLRDEMRQGRISENRRSFFTNEKVVELAKTQDAVAQLLDYYWALRVKDARRDVTERPLRVEIEKKTASEVSNLQNRFSRLRTTFEQGQIDEAKRVLGEFTRELSAESFTDQLLREIISAWRARIAAYEYMTEILKWVEGEAQGIVSGVRSGVVPEPGSAQPQLQDVRPRMSAVEKPSAQETSTVIDVLIEGMKDCPPDAFTQVVYKKWETLFEQLRIAWSDSLSGERDKRRGKAREEYQLWIGNVLNSLEAVRTEARAKLKQHRAIVDSEAT